MTLVDHQAVPTISRSRRAALDGLPAADAMQRHNMLIVEWPLFDDSIMEILDVLPIG
ncbi:hypothetical protein [Methylorubrum sp. SB2]|uniref:hypothetical protein n=1 Tax=Methylorubrum subtropicum TaxID=3138812 RepID=UPI00313CE3AA